MGKINSKQKGKRGELELAHFLTDSGHEARRGQQFKGTPDSPDIICESLDFLHIECKRTESLSIYKALEQAQKDKGDSQKAVVFHRRNGKEWTVILNASDFLALIGDKSHN
jgi:Holliday junction resolvase